MKNGLNAELPGNKRMTLTTIQGALKNGAITMADIDARLKESFMMKLKHLTYFGEDTPSGYHFPDFQKMMFEAGTAGAVLLKNEKKSLPLKKSQSVALIGPFADNRALTVGNQGSSTVFDSYGVTLAEALKKRGVDVTVTEGCNAAYWNERPIFSKDFPCTIKFFNGLEFDGPVIHTVKANQLDIASIVPGPDAHSTVGIDGKAFLTDGRVRLTVGTVKQSQKGWTLACWLKWDDQFLNPNDTLMHVWSDNDNYADVRASALLIKQEEHQARDAENWDDMNRRWTPVVLVSNGKSLTLYRNGKKISTVPMKKPMETFKYYIGGARVGGGRAVSIEVDDMRVWKQPLSDKQIVRFSTRKLAGLPATADRHNFENPQKYVQVKNGIPGLKDKFKASLRVTGKIDIEQAGKYFFSITTVGACRVMIDKDTIFNQWDEQAGEGKNKFFWHTFDKTGKHDVVVEYATKGGRFTGQLALSYASPPPVGTDIFKAARENAAAADVAVVCVGVGQKFTIGGNPESKNPATRGYRISIQGENSDRSQYKLPSWQDELLQEVIKVNPNTVVVLFTAGGVDMNAWGDEVPAILEVFHPGSEGGTIISSLLYGDVNPSGKLTLSWPFSAKDLPYNGTNSHYHNTVNEFGYRYFEKQGIPVRYPFGFGLSYTTFDYQNLTVQKVDNERYPLMASVTLKNTGTVRGKEIVQIYSSDIKSSVEQPVKELAGFEKVDLLAGQTKTVQIPLHWTAFKFFDVKSNSWKQEPGAFKIIAARSATHPEKEVIIN